MERRDDLTALLAIAGRPVRVHEAATALEIDLDEVVRLSEALTEQGVVADTTEGLTLIEKEQEPPSPSRQAYLASQWAKALAELNASPVEIGRALLAAGQFRAAGEHLLPVALSDRALEAVEGALEAARGGATISPQDEGRLRLARAIHRRARGESAGASEDLEVAVLRLEGAELVDALGFAAAVADDLQHPQEAETYTAMAEAQAAAIGEPAKLGSLLTLHGRQLSRIGFPDEADRVLGMGVRLVDEHGNRDQRHRCRLNHAWVWFDRGEMRKAEAAYAILRDQARDMDRVDLADREAYWARTLFGIGHATDALQAASRAEEVARATDAEAPLMIAELARMEGATLFGRHEEAVEHAERAHQIAERALPAWENFALVGMARALTALGRREEAREAIDAALEATPPGVDGWRIRIQAEELALVLTPESERWPQREAEDLTDALLQARWFSSAVHLMAERARRESDKDLGLEGAALALQNGNPMLAALAVEAAQAWDDPTVAPVVRAVRALEPQVPPEWLEEWLAYAPVAGAYRVEVDEEVDSSALEQRIDDALQAAGLSGVDMVLSPAQRQARGLVRRRPVRGRRVLTTLGAAAAVVVLSGLTALGVIMTQPDPTIPTTEPAPPTTLRLEDTVISVPETRFNGVTLHRGGDSRAGVVEGGFREWDDGIYWRESMDGRFGTDPVFYGSLLYVGMRIPDELLLVDANGMVNNTISTGNRVLSAPVVQRTEGGVTYLIFGADDATVYGREAFSGGQLWQASVEGNVSDAPLVIGNTAVVATNAGAVIGLDVDTGGRLWEYQGTETAPLAPVDTAPAHADGVVYVVDQEGTLHLIDSSSGSGICTFSASSPLAGGGNPIISDGVVYLPTDTGFIDMLPAGECSGRPPDRAANQIFALPGGFQLPPAISDNVIYAVDGFRLVAMEAIWDECGADANVEPQDRCLVWQERGGSFAADSRITTAPLLADGVLYIGTQDGIVHAVDAANGEELWSFDADARVEGIAVIPNAVFVTTADGTLIAIAGESATE